MVKRIIKYILGTNDLGLLYDNKQDMSLVGYMDSDWVGDSVTRRSTSGYCFYIGQGALSWSCKKQPTVALSSTEAEYRGLMNAACESIWIRGFLKDVGIDVPQACIFCDNLSAIKLTHNPVFHARTKHIEIHYHFIREKVQEGSVVIQYCTTNEQVADIFTKSLGKEKFNFCREMLGLREVNDTTSGGGVKIPDLYIHYPSMYLFFLCF